jgi:hypothetical protein
MKTSVTPGHVVFRMAQLGGSLKNKGEQGPHCLCHGSERSLI